MPAKLTEGIIPTYIEIGKDALTIEPPLKVRPKGGVRIMFRFQFSEPKPDTTRHLVGIAHLWDDDDEDDYPSAENLENNTDEIIVANNFLKHWKYSGSLQYLFRIQSGDPDVLTMDDLILGEVLEWFLEDHAVTASISALRSAENFGLMIDVDFGRNGASMFWFQFSVHDKEVVKALFDYRSAPKRVV
ncbi:MAG: hypothetical protein KGH79_02600 [Patescibacteria group bacterium]|nr:hypothetical protein [Patescibacteria group bacterium]